MLHRLRTAPFGVVILVSLLSFFTPGSDLPSGVDIWDKLGHALLFAALAVTGRLARLRAAVLGPALLGYGAAVEVLQSALPLHRDGDWHDVVADSVGILAGLLTALVVAMPRRRRGGEGGSTTRSEEECRR